MFDIVKTKVKNESEKQKLKVEMKSEGGKLK